MLPAATVYERSGVTVVRPDTCDDSYRLYSGRSTEAAHLIDIHGREVHRWEYVQGQTWHYAHMLGDGHLVAIAKDVMILELDWDSKLVWKHEGRAHHDFARLEGGNTLVVSRRAMTNPWTNEGTLDCDILLEVTPGGETVWQWKVEAHAAELAERVREKGEKGTDTTIAERPWLEYGLSPIVVSVPFSPVPFSPIQAVIGHIATASRTIRSRTRR